MVDTNPRAPTRESVLTTLRENYGHLEELGVVSLALFGSVARGECDSDSDIDLLVEIGESHTFDRYMNIKFFIEDLVGRRVDLVMKDAVKARMRPEIERDAILVS